jgi:hypothetical protein
MNTKSKLFLALTSVTIFLWLIMMFSGGWLPDILTRRTVVLDQTSTSNGDVVELVQSWIGDGYLTELRHTNRSGRAWRLVIDGDAMKDWTGRIQTLTEGSIAIHVAGEQISYNLYSHVGTDRLGRPKSVLEIPEDGTPSFFVKQSPGAEANSWQPLPK